MSIAYQCLTAVKTAIESLALAGDPPIVIQKQPWNRGSLQEGIFLSPLPETISPATNCEDDVGYGVMVVLICASNQDLTGNLDQMLTWRESISQGLRNQTLAGVPEVYNTRVEPSSVFWPEGFEQQYDVGALVVRCVAREPHA